MKYLKCLTISLAVLISNSLSGQNIHKSKGLAKGESFNFYYMLPAEKTEGILVLLPGWGESPQSIFKKTELPAVLAQRGYLTVVPELKRTLFADDFQLAEIDLMISMLKEKHSLGAIPLVIGGLSAGGSVAIGYAEYLLSEGKNSGLKAVFVIDPPLDLERMYISSERKIKYACLGLVQKEGVFIKNYLENALGGSPVSKPDEYLKRSSFSANAVDGGRAKFLKNIPVRLYTEPDLEFVRKTYCSDLQFDDINATDLEKLNKFLQQAGNTRSEYIATKGKGFHSWNIPEAKDCADWILKSGNQQH